MTKTRMARHPGKNTKRQPTPLALSAIILAGIVAFGFNGAGASDDGEAMDVVEAAAALAHEQLFVADRYPSANTCGQCHPQQFKEWSASQHAYALFSPVFTALHGTILKKTNGTFGDFCIRCHTPVGMNLGEPVFMSALDRHTTSREGVTCVVCHRVNQPFGKISGRLAIVEGDSLQPIYGPKGNKNLQEVLADPQKYRVIRITPDSRA